MVLPAPLEPSRAKMLPRATSKSTPRSTCSSSYDFSRACTWIAGPRTCSVVIWISMDMTTACRVDAASRSSPPPATSTPPRVVVPAPRRSRWQARLTAAASRAEGGDMTTHTKTLATLAHIGAALGLAALGLVAAPVAADAAATSTRDVIVDDLETELTTNPCTGDPYLFTRHFDGRVHMVTTDGRTHFNARSRPTTRRSPRWHPACRSSPAPSRCTPVRRRRRPGRSWRSA